MIEKEELFISGKSPKTKLKDILNDFDMFN